MARKLVTPKPLEQQIYEFKAQVDFSNLLKIYENTSKFKGTVYLSPGKYTPEYTEYVKKRNQKWDELKKMGYLGSYFSPSNLSFIDVFEQNLKALQAQGFTIMGFSTKFKVDLRKPKHMKTERQVLEAIVDSGITGYMSITLKPRLAIYWQRRT